MSGADERIRASIAEIIRSTELSIFNSFRAPGTWLTREQYEHHQAEARAIQAVRDARRDLLMPAFVDALEALTDPTARAVLDLHARQSSGVRECDACGGDPRGESPWPCSTVTLIAALHGIPTLPEEE